MVVDGNVLAVYRAVAEAAERARRGDGPTLLEFKTFRMRGHEEASGVDYVPQELIEEWTQKDPVVRFERLLFEHRVISEADRDAVRKAYKLRIDALTDDALATPEPVSTAEEKLADVFAPSLLVPNPPSPEALASGRTLRYVDAISDALRVAMRRKPNLVLLGQDIAEYGGVFKVTDGFLEEFGKERVRNTPIIESGAVGAALGLALDGFIPMVEMQFGDFITCAFNQIVNNLAKTHFRWGARIPVVIRVPVGGGTGAGPFHSQNIEAGSPAWRVSRCWPRRRLTPGLAANAFEDGNPILPGAQVPLSFGGPGSRGLLHFPSARPGGARRARRHLVTYGVGVNWALEAAELSAAQDKQIEVVDLRSLLPWDVETVVTSIKKTSRALVLHEAPLTGGFGGEIAAVLGRQAFEWLDAPVMRLGALDTPVPSAKALEAIFSPKGRLMTALGELLAY